MIRLYPSQHFYNHLRSIGIYSTSSKHSYPTYENNAKIDWTFKNEWLSIYNSLLDLKLKNSIDEVYRKFCLQIPGKTEEVEEPLEALIDNQRLISHLEREIKRIESALKKAKQFNKKVALNIKLKEIEQELIALRDN